MFEISGKFKYVSSSAGWSARNCFYTILATIFSLFSVAAIYDQFEDVTVNFNIPSLTLPQALGVFGQQAGVELVFAEHGFDSVRTTAVAGSFQRERALEMLLAGTGLQVDHWSGDRVIVQPTDASVPLGVTTSLAVEDSGAGLLLPRCW